METNSFIFLTRYHNKIYKIPILGTATKKGAIKVMLGGKIVYFYKPHWHETLEEAQKQIKENINNEIREYEQMIKTLYDIKNGEIELINGEPEIKKRQRIEDNADSY